MIIADIYQRNLDIDLFKAFDYIEEIIDLLIIFKKTYFSSCLDIMF